MKKSFLWITLLLFAFLVAACDQIPPLNQIREAYLQTRVVQLVTEMVTQTPPASALLVATQAAKAEETQITPEQPTATLLSYPKDFPETPATVPSTETPMPLPTETPTTQPTFTPIPTTLPPTETPQLAQTFTPVPTPTSTDPAVYLGKPVWKDTFDENRGWAVDTDSFASVSIANGTMTLTARSTYDAWRLAPTGSLGNNYVEARFTTGQCNPNDHFGLMFRVPVLETADQGYQFGITCDGRYLLRKYDGKAGGNGSMVSLIPWTPSAEIHAGSNQTNRLGIMTINDRLLMFINGVLVGEAKDKTYPQGYIGIFLGSRVTKNFAIQVDDLAYWKNPVTP